MPADPMCPRALTTLRSGWALLPLMLAVALPLPAQEPATAAAAPPVAEVQPHRMEIHGHVRTDDYYWLRERENPAVIEYLEAENAYTDQMLAHTEALQEELFQEIRGRIKETDESVPYELNGYWYYTRYEEGKEYPIYARRAGSMDGPEEVMLDANQRGAGHGYYAASGLQVSPGNGLLAFAEDTVGRRIYTLRIRDLRTGRMLPDVIDNVESNVEWANDDRTLFYLRKDSVTLRPYQVWRHRVGTDPAEDELVYQEDDDTYYTFLSKTKSRQYIMIGVGHTLRTEFRYLDADRPDDEFRVLLAREGQHEYYPDHFGDHFYILTNDGAPNFRLVRSPVSDPSRGSWEEVLPHREDVLLEGIEIFRDHLVVTERQEGLRQLRVRPWTGDGEHYVAFDEPAYLAYASTNREFDTRTLRFVYTSLVTPSSTYDYDMETRERTLLKRDEVVGGHEPDEYVTERLHATARDGTEVPVSLVYREGTPLDGSAPLLLYAYGSYGSSMDAAFSSARLSLIDRGFVYAIAHIRGGSDMGRQWYEDGKLFNKRNTFTDYIDVAQHLVDRRYTAPERLYGQGGSAGGLLMGAVVNMRPDLFDGIIAGVPFVDVITTMLDASIPLTTFEYDEWGNPNDPDYYEYMLGYSPYDQVMTRAYPNMLVTTGLHDSQVQYFEPAKWVAKLRAMKTDDNVLLLHTNMEAGHGGASGRFRRYREIALQYAFLLDLAGRAGL